MENNINLTPDAVKAIQALQHPCGTYECYRNTINRLFNFVLRQSDEIGMSEFEAISTLRVLDLLRDDVAAIAGPASSSPCERSAEDVAYRVHVMADDLDISEDGGEGANEVEPTDEDERMEKLNDAFSRLMDARYSVFRLMGAVPEAERVSAIREMPERIEVAIIEIGKLRTLGGAGK